MPDFCTIFRYQNIPLLALVLVAFLPRVSFGADVRPYGTKEGIDCEIRGAKEDTFDGNKFVFSGLDKAIIICKGRTISSPEHISATDGKLIFPNSDVGKITVDIQNYDELKFMLTEEQAAKLR